MISFRAVHFAAAITLFICSVDARERGDATKAHRDAVTNTVRVAGSGVDHLTTAIVHAQEFTPTGMIQKSTETVELTGDLKGRVLYHVTSVFDFVAGTLVNTGDQVYSGTIRGLGPVMTHDDKFRFDANLVTGEETGQVYLFNHIAGPKVKCKLDVVGTGLTAEGNPTFDYSGACTFQGQRQRTQLP